jgi:hypothetical protein
MFGVWSRISGDKNNMHKIRYAILLVIILALSAFPVLAQDEPSQVSDPEQMEETYLAEFNRILRDEIGTRALARNDILDDIAQKTAEALGCTNEPVEFDINQDVMDAGYKTYPGDNSTRTTRIPLLPIVNFRPIEEMATFYTEDIFETIDQDGRYYREIGVGVAPCIVDLGDEAVGSTPQYSMFIILGSQPDVIPVVVGNGTDQITVDAVPVTVPVSIHQENSRQIEGIFGRAATVRLSAEPLTDSNAAQAYEPLVQWELTECGPNTIYYELTDEAGLTLSGETAVEVVCPE